MHQGPSLDVSTSSRFDPEAAHPARVYNVWIGGKDAYAADRRAAEEVARHRPQVVAGARANRAFLTRAVRYLAGQRGIRQFLDIGPGLPAPFATHQVAQAIDPQSKIAYVDNDPLVLSHARALTSSREGTCEYIDADLRDPETILKDAVRTLDFTQPAAVMLVAVLHFLPDADDPQGVVAALARALAPGSFVAISHLTSDFAPDAVTSGVAAYNALVPAGITARTHAQVTALFGGLPLVPPGIVPVAEWRPAHLGPPTSARPPRLARPQRRCVRRAGRHHEAAPVITASPGYDEIILTTPDAPQPCNSLACARAGRLAEVIVTYGVLNDPGASPHHRAALWPESWGHSVPMCAGCWEQSRQVAVKYRPGVVVRDLTGPAAAPQPPMGRP